MCGKKIDIKKKINLKKRALRSYFLHIEKDSEKEEITDLQQQILNNGMVYLQMRLPIEKITKEFENTLKEKIERNIFQANIREAELKDLSMITDIYNKSWLTSSTPFKPIQRGTLKKIFTNQNTVFLIAKVYGDDGGFVILDFEGENNEYGVIAGLGVLPRFQGKGLGTILGLAAWNYFKEKGLKELRCEVYKDNQKSFYFIKGLNFEEFGRIVYRKEDFELD
ncbi:MAG: GNAT family N-acetyltransferase [Candidatus Lokiarchaeota archaeon]|nr:GNAT family N-acetyltransferase [Candidatus Lokiarchaeota archaeon]